MISIVTEEDLSQLRKEMTEEVRSTQEELYYLRREFNEVVKRLTELEQQLGIESTNVVSISRLSLLPAGHGYEPFGTIEAAEKYVDDAILAANIPNLDADALTEFKNRKTTYYIRNMIDRYASEADKTYLININRPSQRISHMSVWVKDAKFTQIVQSVLPIYINNYLRNRYADIDKLTHRQQHMKSLKRWQQNKDSVIETVEGTCNTKEFNSRFEAAIRQFKRTKRYATNFHALGDSIREVIYTKFTSEDLQACRDTFYIHRGKAATRDIDAIASVPRYAFRFISAFEKLVDETK